jgi:hypothetical protein
MRQLACFGRSLHTGVHNVHRAKLDMIGQEQMKGVRGERGLEEWLALKQRKRCHSK